MQQWWPSGFEALIKPDTTPYTRCLNRFCIFSKLWGHHAPGIKLYRQIDRLTESCLSWNYVWCHFWIIILFGKIRPVLIKKNIKGLEFVNFRLWTLLKFNLEIVNTAEGQQHTRFTLINSLVFKLSLLLRAAAVINKFLRNDKGSQVTWLIVKYMQIVKYIVWSKCYMTVECLLCWVILP